MSKDLSVTVGRQPDGTVDMVVFDRSIVTTTILTFTKEGARYIGEELLRAAGVELRSSLPSGDTVKGGSR